MNIRSAVAEDLPALIDQYEIIHRTYEEVDADFDRESISEFITSTIASDAGEILIAESEGGIVGICTFFVYPLFFNKRIKHSNILTFWVPPEVRGAGVGARLLKACETVSKERSAEKLIVGVHRNNSSANSFFQKSGLRVLDNVFIKEVN